MSDDKDGIYVVETVPPPEGETDAYNAPTKIGPMAAAMVNEMVERAQQQSEQETAPPRSGPLSRPRSGGFGPMSRPPSVPSMPSPGEAMPISAASPASVKPSRGSDRPTPTSQDASGSLPELGGSDEDEFDPAHALEPSSLVQQINASLPPPVPELSMEERTPQEPDPEDGVFESPIATTRPEWQAASRAEPTPAKEASGGRTYLLVLVLLMLLAMAGYLLIVPRLH